MKRPSADRNSVSSHTDHRDRNNRRHSTRYRVISIRNACDFPTRSMEQTNGYSSNHRDRSCIRSISHRGKSFQGRAVIPKGNGISSATRQTRRPGSQASSPAKARNRFKLSRCPRAGVVVSLISIGINISFARKIRSTSSPSWDRQYQRPGFNPAFVKHFTASMTISPSKRAPPMAPERAASALGWRVRKLTMAGSSI